MKRTVFVTMTAAKSDAQKAAEEQKEFDMKGNLAIKQYLIDNGFVYTGTCNCGGQLTYKFEYTTTQGKLNMRTRASSFLFAKAGERYNKYPIAQLKKMVDEVKRNYEAPATNT